MLLFRSNNLKEEVDRITKVEKGGRISMMDRVESNSIEYRRLCGNDSVYIKHYGFDYLNSGYYAKILNEVEKATDKALQKLNDDTLIQTYYKWNEVHEKREDEMIRNI